MAIPACAHTPPPTSPGGIIDCTTAAVRGHAIEIIPRVNDCLAAPSSWEACLLSLIVPALGITEDVVACTVQARGRSFATAAEANTRDSLSAIAAERARQFVKSRGYVFGP